ncbi:MAG: type II toxin-antitoxin system antitoxin SocA domain-containing protein [Nitrospirota bacterium]
MSANNKNKVLSLIKAICTKIKEDGGYLNKTKLIKYLYLIDIEHYQKFNETFTGFEWIFKDYGPWAFEYNDIFSEMERTSDFKITEGSRPDLDTKFIAINRDSELELDKIITDLDLELKIRRVIERWSNENLAPLLNYVYFNTAPMVDAERGKPLDFNKIKSVTTPPKFKLTHSEFDCKRLKAIKEKILGQREGNKQVSKVKFTPARFDEVYEQGIGILEKEEV